MRFTCSTSRLCTPNIEGINIESNKIMNDVCQEMKPRHIHCQTLLSKFDEPIFLKAHMIVLLATFFMATLPLFAQEKMKKFPPPDSVAVKSDSLASQTRIEAKRIPHDSSFGRLIWHMPKSALNQYFHDDLGDVLHYLPGVFLFDLGSSGQVLQAGFHGANQRQVAILFDDRPLHDPVWGGFDLNYLPVAFISKLDVLAGVSAPLAPTHPEIISIASDEYGEDVPYSQVSYHKAPYGYSDVDAVLGQRISKKMTVLVGGFIKSFDGKTTEQNFEQQNVRARIDYRLSPRWNFQYSLLNNKLNRHLLNADRTDSDIQFPNTTQKNSRIDHTLKINGRLLGGANESFAATIFYSSQHSKLLDQASNLRLNTPANYFGTNFINSFSLLRQKAAIGGNFLHQQTDADSIGNHAHSSGSLFTQFHWKAAPKFRVDFNGNLLLHNLFSMQFSGGVAAYSQISKSLELSLGMKQSMRYPTFFELYSRGTFSGNLALKAELHREINSGLRWKPASNLSLMTNAYLKTVERYIDIQSIDSATTRLLNRTKSMEFAGADLHLNWEIFSRLTAFSAFQVIDNRKLLDQPNFRLTSYLQYSDSLFQNDLLPTIRIEGVIIGARKSSYLPPFYLVQSPKNLNPTFLLNAHLILNFGNLKAFFSLFNVLNENYEMISGFPMSERSLHYGIRWEFWN